MLMLDHVLIDESEGALRRYAIQLTGLAVEQLDAAGALAVMSSWYVAERADGAGPLEEGCDMLLVQHWSAIEQGIPSFAYDFTRQFITPHTAEDADDAFWQLSMTLFFTGDPSGWPDEGNQWCPHPSEVEAFVRTVDASAACAAVRDLTPARVVIDFGPAG